MATAAALSLGNSVAMDTSSDVACSPLFLLKQQQRSCCIAKSQKRRVVVPKGRNGSYLLESKSWHGWVPLKLTNPRGRNSRLLYSTLPALLNATLSHRIEKVVVASPRSKLTGKWNLCFAILRTLRLLSVMTTKSHKSAVITLK